MAFTYTGTQVELGFGRGWLNAPAAASIRRIDRQIGHALQVTEAGRTWAQQNVHYRNYLRYGSPIALSPDAPSLHQMGNAIDSNEAQRIHAVMEDHGWRRTVYRYVNGKWTLVEPWHYEYFPQYDNHINESAGGSSTSPEGLFMFLSKYDEELIRNAVVDINNRTAAMAKAMEVADAKVAGIHAIYVERDANGWTFANVVQSHVVATLAELRAAGVATGGIDVDDLTKRIVDEQARRLAD